MIGRSVLFSERPRSAAARLRRAQGGQSRYFVAGECLTPSQLFSRRCVKLALDLAPRQFALGGPAALHAPFCTLLDRVARVHAHR